MMIVRGRRAQSQGSLHLQLTDVSINNNALEDGSWGRGTASLLRNRDKNQGKIERNDRDDTSGQTPADLVLCHFFNVI